MPPPAPSSMKLLIDTGAQRVLFAEAGKDVADFILGLVAMPLGAVTRLLPGGGSLGSIGNVYASAEKMEAAYLQSTAARDALLAAGVAPAPAAPPPAAAAPSVYPSLPLYLYRCDNCLGSPLANQRSRGFVKDIAKYTVMDDLTVTPTSNVSSVVLLKNLGVKDLHALEETTVNIGHDQAMDILKAALHSKTVLTDAFLKSNRERIRLPLQECHWNKA